MYFMKRRGATGMQLGLVETGAFPVPKIMSGNGIAKDSEPHWTAVLDP